MKPKRIGDIELEHDDRLLHADWRAQHIGWWAFVLIIIAALAGVFGSGPLSGATVTDEAAGISLRYERVARWDSPLLMRLTLLPGENNSAQIWIGNAYMEAAPLQWINPPPMRSVTLADRTIYEFAVNAGGSGAMTFEFRPQRMGMHTLSIGRGDGDGLLVKQFILP